MKTAPKLIIILGAAAVAVVAAVIVVRPLLGRRDALRYVTRPVGYADITATVSETGTVNPVNTVSVGSEVSGTVQTLGADFNSHVKKDQILATLDPTDYQAAVDSSSANLRLAEANLNSSNVNVGKMKALLDMANLTLRRDTDLLTQGLINQNQVDTDNTGAVTANQDYLAAQASVQVAEAQVAVAQGQLDQAKFNLSKTIIRSPMEGIVMARNVSIGQTVAASLQTPTIFSLATNLTDMQVDTSVDEADAGTVKEGASARFTVTAYPNETFLGTVIQLRINPTVVQNVVTYDAVVAVHDTSGRLLPGMTAQVTIDVGKVSHVPSVPIAGVLYRPLAAPSGGGGFGGFGAGVFQSSGAAPGAQAVAGAPGSQVTVWVLQDGHPVPRRVVIGLSDSTNVQIASGPVNPGDPIIVAQRRGGSGGSSATGSNGGANSGSSAGSAAASAGPGSGSTTSGVSNGAATPRGAGGAASANGSGRASATGSGTTTSGSHPKGGGGPNSGGPNGGKRGTGNQTPGTGGQPPGTGTQVPSEGLATNAVQVQSP